MEMRTDQPLGQMSLMTLAEHCAQEIDKYRQNEPSDERYSLEIVRRVVILHDHEAWAILQQQFTGQVRLWLAHHTYRDAALRYESEQDYIDHTFRRFWQAVSDQTLTFTSLASVLRYIRLCLHCTIMDMLRGYANTPLKTLPEPELPNDPLVENEMWEAIHNLLTDERERRVAYLQFRCNLKPGEIMRYYPDEFRSVEEIYRLKRNIMERIMRNMDKIRMRLSDTLS